MTSEPSSRRRSTFPDPVADAAALRTFVAVARLGTVVAAARALGRTQPSVSARLSSLESAWQTKLFRREAKGMAMTPEGARLLPLAEQALRALDEIDRAAGVPISTRRDLRVGAGDALGREILPRALARLMRGDPSISVRLVEGSASRLLDALRAGEIDLALVAATEPPSVREGLTAEFLLASPVVLLAPPGQAPARRGRPATLESLRGRRLVTLQPGSAFRRHVESACARRGIPFLPAVEVGNLSLVRRFVAAGLGIAPVPAVAFAEQAPHLAVERRLLPEVPPVRYARMTRSGAPLAKECEHLLSLVRETAAAQDAR